MFAFLPVMAAIWMFSYDIKGMVIWWKMQRFVFWMFHCSGLVIRDLTLRSASSFGSFHLMNILFGDYILYLILHKVAAANHTTPVAIYAKEEVRVQFYWCIRYIHLVLCVVGKACYNMCYSMCIFAAKTSEWNYKPNWVLELDWLNSRINMGLTRIPWTLFCMFRIAVI